MRALLASLLLACCLTAVYWAGAESGRRAEHALRARGSEPLAQAPSEIETALSIADAAARAAALSKILAEAGPSDIEPVFDILNHTNLPVGGLALVIIADWAASLDPQDAFRRTVALKLRDRDAAIDAVIRRWARQDPHEARRVVEKSNDPRGAALYEALVTGWAERVGDAEAWSFVESMDMGPPRQKLIEVLVGRKLVIEGVEPTLRYVESLPDDGLRRFKLQIFRRTARALARRDPERAVQWVQQHRDGPYGDGLLRKVATARVIREGAPGIEWLVEVEEGPQRDEAVVESYRRWLFNDRDVAQQWLRDAQYHPALEPALVMLVGATARSDPAAAFEIVERLQNPEHRQSAKFRLGTVWLRRDAAAATKWIRDSDLPDALKAQLLDGQSSS